MSSLVTDRGGVDGGSEGTGGTRQWREEPPVVVPEPSKRGRERPDPALRLVHLSETELRAPTHDGPRPTVVEVSPPQPAPPQLGHTLDHSTPFLRVPIIPFVPFGEDPGALPNKAGFGVDTDMYRWNGTRETDTRQTDSRDPVRGQKSTVDPSHLTPTVPLREIRVTDTGGIVGVHFFDSGPLRSGGRPFTVSTLGSGPERPDYVNRKDGGETEPLHRNEIPSTTHSSPDSWDPVHVHQVRG